MAMMVWPDTQRRWAFLRLWAIRMIIHMKEKTKVRNILRSLGWTMMGVLKEQHHL
ncbi:hypothetical protein Y017_07760 [Alcanivorax sp. 97CO-5]|nr:hypothetical protein Y017_07760 [Alcanivorax sp. 97CO-5]